MKSIAQQFHNARQWVCRSWSERRAATINLLTWWQFLKHSRNVRDPITFNLVWIMKGKLWKYSGVKMWNFAMEFFHLLTCSQHLKTLTRPTDGVDCWVTTSNDKFSILLAPKVPPSRSSSFDLNSYLFTVELHVNSKNALSSLGPELHWVNTILRFRIFKPRWRISSFIISPRSVMIDELLILLKLFHASLEMYFSKLFQFFVALAPSNDSCHSSPLFIERCAMSE